MGDGPSKEMLGSGVECYAYELENPVVELEATAVPSTKAKHAKEAK